MMRFRRTIGFTLFELLVVLAIVVMIMTLSVPSLQRIFARAQFKAGVVELQTELYQTRLLAMKTGTPYIFRYQPGTDLYEIMPKEVLQQAIYRDQASLAGNGSTLGTAGTGSEIGRSEFVSTNSTANGSFSDFAAANSFGGATTIKYSDDVFALPDDSRPNSLDGGFGWTQDFSNAGASSESSGFSNFSRTESSNAANAVSGSKFDESPSDNTVRMKTTEFGVAYRKTLTRNVLFGIGTISQSTPSNLKTDAPLQNGQEIETDLGSAFVGSLESPSERAASSREIWSEPIVFYPNGRTSSAVFFLLSEGRFEYYSEIAIRGVTGIPRISAISSAPPDDPAFPSALSRQAIAELYAERSPDRQNQIQDEAAFGENGFSEPLFDPDESINDSGYVSSPSASDARTTTEAPAFPASD